MLRVWVSTNVWFGFHLKPKLQLSTQIWKPKLNTENQKKVPSPTCSPFKGQNTHILAPQIMLYPCNARQNFMGHATSNLLVVSVQCTQLNSLIQASLQLAIKIALHILRIQRLGYHASSWLDYIKTKYS
jgi:hypothetical protein